MPKSPADSAGLYCKEQMSNHPNRNWRNRWKIDLAQQTATHDCGLVVRFSATADGGHAGEVAAYPPDMKIDRFSRLLREAGEIYRAKI